MGVTVAIIKPVGDGCNSQCKYCYVDGNLHRISFMQIDDAKKIVDELMSQADIKKIEFLWHGGEPLLRGKDFFHTIFEYQKKYDGEQSPKYVNAIQTNLILLDDGWIDLFLQYNIGISTSLDGPQYLHDINRLRADGTKTYNLIVDKIKLAQKANMKVNVLTVVSKTNMNYAKEIFSELNDLNISHVGFLPCFLMCNETVKSPSLEPGEYAKFLISFFDLYLNNESSFEIREFDQIFSAILTKPTDICCYTGRCSNFIVIDSNCDVYACDTRSPQKKYLYGNLLTNGIQDALNSDQRKKLINELNILPHECSECDYLDYCHNGCYNMRVNGRFNYCEDRKNLFKYMLDLARKVINDGGKQNVG